MSASWDVTIRNTFVHVRDDIPDSDCGSPIHRAETDPLPGWLACRMTEVAPRSLPAEPEPADLRGDPPGTDGLSASLSGSATPTPRSLRKQSSGSFSLSESDSADSSYAAQGLPPWAAPDLIPCHMPMVVQVALVLLPVAGGAGCPAEQLPPPPPPPRGEPTRVLWAVGAGLVGSEDPKVESAQFLIDVPGLGQQPFQIALYAAGSRGRRGALNFRRSGGHGRVEVRSLSQFARGTARFSMGATISAGTRTQPPRPLAPHDFSERACCTWRKWDFRSAVDSSTLKLTVQIDFVPLTSASS